MNVEDICKRIHEMLEVLPMCYEPSEKLPLNGIYFFYEKGENTPHTGKQRIVRVGTHGKSRSLKQRLRDHYNGNREGSIFRKHLGTAILKSAGASDDWIREWRKRRKKSPHWKEFEDIEKMVDKILRSNFSFRVICVDNPRERKMFEEKIIATISTCSICKPSKNWLGNLAWSNRVRESGLWNSNFINSPLKLTQTDIERLKQLIQKTLYILNLSKR